ncbi:aminotransferase class I/II-fold pyridoxal phosphate-dependent enzyme [Candidatus Vidania fulgoroideorum]
MIKLNKMEFPYNFKKKIKIKEFINFYPLKKKKKKLIKIIKKKFKIKNKIILGNGSDELIFFLISCYKKKEFNFVSSFYPSFSMYEFYSKSCNIPFIKIKLCKKFNFNTKKLIKFINFNKCGIFFISYPNNPTGNLFKKRNINKLIKNCKNTLFVLDEAYYFFSKKKINLRNNVVILRTFSKIGFAGLRMGILICNNRNYNYLIKKQSPYNINILVISFFINFFKKNTKKLNIKINKLIKEKKRIYNKIKKKVYKSYGNFFLVKKKYFFLNNKFKKNNFKTKIVKINNFKYFRFSIWKKKINNKIIKIFNE